MSILCKPLLPSVRLGGFCCYLACSPHKPWTHKLTLPPPILQEVGRQRFFCITGLGYYAPLDISTCDATRLLLQFCYVSYNGQQERAWELLFRMRAIAMVLLVTHAVTPMQHFDFLSITNNWGWNHLGTKSHLATGSFQAQSDNSHHASHNALRDWTSSIGETIKESKHTRHLQIVLFSPQIAGNTGSIARTCAAASVGLHLIEPLGFQIDDAKLKRAGLDYWPDGGQELAGDKKILLTHGQASVIFAGIIRFVFVKVHASWSEFMQFFKQQEGEKRLVAFTKRGTCLYTEKEYKAGDWLVFGSETSGLSAEALEDCADELNHGGGKVRIPMLDTYVRSLNLSVSVGIGVYEALRQLNVLRNLFNETNDSLLEDCSEEMSDDKEVDRECLLSAVEQ